MLGGSRRMVSGPLAIRRTDKAARSFAQPYFRVTAAQAILKKPRMVIF